MAQKSTKIRPESDQNPAKNGLGWFLGDCFEGRVSLEQLAGCIAVSKTTLRNYFHGKRLKADTVETIKQGMERFAIEHGKTADEAKAAVEYALRARGQPPPTGRAKNKEASAAPEKTQETAEAVASISFKKSEDSPSLADTDSAALVSLMDELTKGILRVARDPISEFVRGQGIGRCPTIPTPEELGGVINREIIRAARELREHLRLFVGLQHPPGEGLNLVVSTIERWASYIDVSGSAVRQVGCKLISEDTPERTHEALEDCCRAAKKLLLEAEKDARRAARPLPPWLAEKDRLRDQRTLRGWSRLPQGSGAEPEALNDTGTASDSDPLLSWSIWEAIKKRCKELCPDLTPLDKN